MGLAYQKPAVCLSGSHLGGWGGLPPSLSHLTRRSGRSAAGERTGRLYWALLAGGPEVSPCGVWAKKQHLVVVKTLTCRDRTKMEQTHTWWSLVELWRLQKPLWAVPPVPQTSCTCLCFSGRAAVAGPERRWRFCWPAGRGVYGGWWAEGGAGGETPWGCASCACPPSWRDSARLSGAGRWVGMHKSSWNDKGRTFKTTSFYWSLEVPTNLLIGDIIHSETRWFLGHRYKRWPKIQKLK